MNKNIIAFIHALSCFALGAICFLVFQYNPALGIGLLIAALVYIWIG